MQDLRPQDLWNTCAKCTGKGEVTDVGGGPNSRYTRTGPCEACDGRGITLTASGTVLRDFILALQAARMIH